MFQNPALRSSSPGFTVLNKQVVNSQVIPGMSVSRGYETRVNPFTAFVIAHQKGVSSSMDYTLHEPESFVVEIAASEARVPAFRVAAPTIQPLHT